MKTLLVIDGNAIMHRAFHALPPLNNSIGVPTNAIYGFFTMISKVIADFHPEYLVICFDTPVPTFRKQMLITYQIHRKKLPDEFKTQVPIIQNLLDLAGIHRMELPSYEADDVIGTVATRVASETGLRTLILTGDKDLMQLVTESVFVITPLTGVSSTRLYTPTDVQERFGVPPTLIPDLKALMGDSSDNYKGAKGIGPKTAQKLLNQYHSVENMLEKVDTIKEERIRTLISEHTESIILSKQLATILTTLDIPFNLEATRYNGFGENMRSKLRELELSTLLERLFHEKKQNPAKEKEKKKPDLNPDQPELF
ncbi:hypothetical protein HGB07_01655 [Candidatus Roizmanbacteria bacterium]|nr:hypothetical protein [Candidatus Roizmanbacteria bacterium]